MKRTRKDKNTVPDGVGSMTTSQYIYRKIYEQLKKDILAHKYHSHERLPSKRLLSRELGVSVNSVKHAYEQLVAEGYVYTKERQGYFIESLNELVVNPRHEEAVIEEAATTEVTSAFRYSLSHMSTNLSVFPVETWLKLQRQVLKSSRDVLSEIPHIKGPLALRRAIAKLVSFKRGIDCHPEQIILASGANVLVQKLLVLLNDGMKVGVENPGYARMRQVIQQHCRVIPIPLDDKGVRMSEIHQMQPNIMLTTPSHQFPLGMIMPISRRIELLNWAAQTASYVIEDDYDSEFKYGTDNIPSLFSLDQNERVIYLGTFSKTLSPSMRMSYMILPKHLVEPFQQMYQETISDVSTMTALTLAAMIDSGDYEKYIRKMRHIYSQQRIQVVHQLKVVFGRKIKIYDVKAGLHFVVDVESPYTYEEIERRARDRGLELYTLNRFMMHSIAHEQGKTFIIGFANIDTGILPATIQCLYDVLFEE